MAMKDITARLAGAMILAAALASLPASFAQAPAGEAAPRTGPASEVSPMFQRHHAMAGIMKDMVQEMSRMQEEVGKGDLSPPMRKQMATNMKKMSQMMRRMSGAVDRPTMKEAEMRRLSEDMHRQMDQMSQSHSMSDPGKVK
jgi:hypothetical protein